MKWILIQTMLDLIIIDHDKMKKIYYSILGIFTSIVLFGCANSLNLEELSYVTFESAMYSFGVELGGTNTREIKIYASDVTNSDRTFTVNVVPAGTTADPASYVIPPSVTIPGGSNEGIIEVTISDINISSSGETIELTFNNDQTGLFSGQNMIVMVNRICPLNEVKLEITFDDYPEETSWEMYDSSGNLIASGGSYNGMTSFETTWCLPNGDYQFVIYDAYADGICCSYGNGSYALSTNGALIFQGGTFGASQTVNFSLP